MGGADRGWRRRRVVRLGVLSVAAIGWLLSSSPIASAATPKDIGYWWRARSAMGPSVPAPGVPAGGLWVAADGAGQHAVSALRYRARTGEEITKVTLQVANQNGRDIVLLACAAASAWTPVEGGAWDDRPTTSCDVAFVTGAANADGSAWSFDVRGLARRGTLDLVIMSPPGTRSVFSLSFEPPGAGAVATRPTASPSPRGSTASQPSARTRPSVLGTTVRRNASPLSTQPAQSPSSSPFDFAAPSDAFDGARSRMPIVAMAMLALAVPLGLWWRFSNREPPPPPDGDGQQEPPRRRRAWRTPPSTPNRLAVALEPIPF